MSLPSAYVAATGQLVSAFGAGHAIMHVHIGLALYVATQLLVRTRRASMIALHVVIAAEVANEVLERLFYGSWRWDDTLGDVALTLIWPLALTLVGQYRRARWTRLAAARQTLTVRSANLRGVS